MRFIKRRTLRVSQQFSTLDEHRAKSTFRHSLGGPMKSTVLDVRQAQIDANVNNFPFATALNARRAPKDEKVTRRGPPNLPRTKQRKFYRRAEFSNSSLSQQHFSAAFLSSLLRQPFSAAFLNSLASAAFLNCHSSSLPQQPC